jgi:transposase
VEGRERLGQIELPRAARKVVDLCLKMIEHINEELSPIEAELRSYARAQAGCRALMSHYGVGELTSVALFSELGDTRRFSSSKKAVRFLAGLDVTVHSSDGKRAAGKLSRQGSPVLRWAAYEAAKGAYRKSSPDHQYYLQTRERIGTNRAALSIARKLIRRAHHTLRELGEEAMSEPVALSSTL